MSILYPKSRILIELQREIPVYLLIKRLVPFGSSRFHLHHPLPLPLRPKSMRTWPTVPSRLSSSGCGV